MIKSDEFTIAGATEIGLEDIIDTFRGISWTKRVVDERRVPTTFYKSRTDTTVFILISNLTIQIDLAKPVNTSRKISHCE